MGVRVALGARPGQVQGLILGHGLRLFAIGSGLGLVAAFTASRLIRSLLYEVDPADPLIYAIVIGLLGVAALIACWLPALRASRVDPIITLRTE
jgi:ABC-type antimicrobial peptide transport system permease subunit